MIGDIGVQGYLELRFTNFQLILVETRHALSLLQAYHLVKFCR